MYGRGGHGGIEERKRMKYQKLCDYIAHMWNLKKNLIELKSFTNFCNEVGLKKYWQRKCMNQTGTDLKSSILTSSLMV